MAAVCNDSQAHWGGRFHGGLKSLGSQGIGPEFWPLLQCVYVEHLTGPPLPLKVTNPEEEEEEEGEAEEQKAVPVVLTWEV